MKFLDEIRRQPQETREIMFGLSVFVTVILIGMIWFNSFQEDLYTLMNPEDDLEEALVVEDIPAPSLFGYVGQSLMDIKGLVSGLFESQQASKPASQQEVKGDKVYTLPLSEYK